MAGQARQSRKTAPAPGVAPACTTACVEVMKLQVSASMIGSAFLSVRSEIIFDHVAILHDKPDSLKLGDVGYGIAGDGH